MDLSGQTIHCIGIGGIGVSALAEMALQRGARITGSDMQENAQTQRLRQLGATIHVGHDPVYVGDPDLTVYSSAIRADNPERKAAQAKAPILRRGDWLAELMQGFHGVGICGTHGKTTTACLTGHLLEACQKHPTVCLGGIPVGRKSQCWSGNGPHFVAELDESDGSFLAAPVRTGVITNIEPDHLDYYGTAERVCEAFRTFVEQIPSNGHLVLNQDDPASLKLAQYCAGRCLTTGMTPDADVTLRDLHVENMVQHWEWIYRGESLGPVAFPLPGVHNIRNALCALAVGLLLEIPVACLKKALATAVSVERRFQILGTKDGVTVVDDYAHHPTEVAATLQTARASHAGRVIAVFQPHLYSRTQFLADGFGRALSLADQIILADIYPAREAPIPGVTSDLIARALHIHGQTALGPYPISELIPSLRPLIRRGDLVCFIGAGNIGDCAHELVDTL